MPRYTHPVALGTMLSAFYEYQRAVALAPHNERMGRPEFAKLNRRKADSLAAEFPQFPAALERLAR